MLFDKLIDRIAEELNNKRYSRTAAISVWSVYNVRIFEKGLNSFALPIGFYKDGAYKQLRRERGRETKFVNLEMTGMMRKNYQPTKSGTVAYAFTSQDEADKAFYNEQRYGAIFDLTDSEIEIFLTTMEKLLIQ